MKFCTRLWIREEFINFLKFLGRVRVGAPAADSWMQ